MQETYSKITIKTPEQQLVSLLLTLKMFYTLLCCFHCWLWTRKCRQGWQVRVGTSKKIAIGKLKKCWLASTLKYFVVLPLHSRTNTKGLNLSFQLLSNCDISIRFFHFKLRSIILFHFMPHLLPPLKTFLMPSHMTRIFLLNAQCFWFILSALSTTLNERHQEKYCNNITN